MIRDEIYAGGEWLDSVKPGWYDEIDLSSLALRWCNKCVLGQVFEHDSKTGNGYIYARLTFLEPTHILKCGFTEHNGQWDLLTEEWKSYIRMRRALALREEQSLLAAVV